jgi:hypothetical protein
MVKFFHLAHNYFLFSAIKPKTMKTFLVHLVCVLACSISSCEHFYDARFYEHEAYVESSPSEDAIVGMWHRRLEYPNEKITIENNILVKSDKTGRTKSTVDDRGFLGGANDNKADLGPFKWNYLGNGLWHMANDKGRIDECRLSRGRLLRTYKELGGLNIHHETYDRVE